MSTSASDLKSRLEEFLSASGVEFNPAKPRPVLRCPSPDHADAKPSAILYRDSLHVHCPVCNKTWDIFDVAGLLNNEPDFEGQLRIVESMLRVDSSRPERPKAEKKAAEKPKRKPPVPLARDEARKVFTRSIITRIAEAGQFGKFVAVWPYLDAEGLVVMMDVRFERPDGKKNVISFWYDGTKVQTQGAPSPLYGADRLAAHPDLDVIVVEGCKTAAAADTLPGFVAVTWPGGTSKTDRPDWSPLLERAAAGRVYIYPDDDAKKTREGKLKPLAEQPGYKAAFDIARRLPGAKIVRPFPPARKIKADGADMVEALQVATAAELADYVRSAPLVERPRTQEEVNAELAAKNAVRDVGTLPFTILGVGDDGRAAFLGRGGRLVQVAITAITKSHLLAIAPEPWWQGEFGHKGKVSWDSAIDFILDACVSRDYNQDNVRGRGAWAEKDGRICYHNGQETIGEFDLCRLYLRRPRHDIGITGPEATAAECERIHEVTRGLSFETQLDHVRLMGWSFLAPFAGALPWRPAILLTGESGSGKSTILDYAVNPLSAPLQISGGESTEAGVRQRVGVDSSAVVIDEAETDTEKKRRNREALFSLMRMSTSDDAPIVAKGTIDGKGQSFQMRSMFLFAAISPEVTATADDNRIFRVNLIKPDSSTWKEQARDLREAITQTVCAGVRARTWARLRAIVTAARRLTPAVQELSGRDARFSLAEAMLHAAYWIVLRDREGLDDVEFSRALLGMYAVAPPDGRRDENEEILDRLLDERVPVEKPDRGTMTIREILIAMNTNKLQLPPKGTLYDSPLDAAPSTLYHLRAIAERYGLTLTRDGELAIAHNHHEIMKVLSVGKGYHHVLFRHPCLVDKCRPIWLAGKTRRCVLLKGVLEVPE